MRTIKFLILIAVANISYQTSAQQEAHFTQYMDNTLFINPGYAGSRDVMNITGIHREQWVGISGRPRTSTLSIHSPLPYESIGLGLTAVHDAIGPIKHTTLYLDGSYSLKFKNSQGKLAFGIKAGVDFLSVQTDQVQTTEGQDPLMLSAIRNQINPNFGVGIYYHSPKWFIGLSTPKILEHAQEGSDNAIEKRHYYLIGGGVIKLTENWKLRPTAHFKYTPGAPFSTDISLAGILRDKFWLGAMYRWGDSFGAFVQFQFTPQFKAGIAYDQTVSKLARYNKGTYELMLSYDFMFKKSGKISPRYF